VSPYYYITAGIVMAAYIITGLLLGWYLRKFLLEVFFTYDIKSKFIYWLSFVPLLGFLFVLFTVGPAKQQQLYIEKRSSLVQFAESNSSSVVTAFMVLLVIRLLLTLSDGDAISIIFLLVTGVLFFWMSADKTGFYAYFFINLLLLVSGILMMYFSKKPADLVGAMTGLVLLGTIQLIFVFPIFHFGEFEFIPAEEPAEEAHNTDGEFHLFPAMK
jgi:hypothetical protein